MKNLMMLAGLVAAMSFTSCSSSYTEQQVPEAVTKIFTEKYPSAKDVKWLEEEENEWEADFQLGERDMSASFKADGTWLETEKMIKPTELSPNVIEHIGQRLGDFELIKAEMVETPEGKSYQMELNINGEIREVMVSTTGDIDQNPEEEND